MATYTLYAGVNDNMNRSSSASYSTARAGTGTMDVQAFGASNTAAEVGQYLGAGIYYELETYSDYDATGVIGTGATVTSAIFSFAKSSTKDDPGTVEVRLFDWGGTVDATDWISCASLGSYTLLATHSTIQSVSVNSYADFTDVAAPANVVKNGVTRVMLATDQMRLGNAPTTLINTFQYYTTEQSGSTLDPKLTVVATSQYSQTVSGAATPTGTAARTAAKLPTGGATPSGAAVRTTKKNPSGAATPGGAVVRQALHKLAGSIASAGAAVRNKTTAKALTGTIANAGAVVRQAAKSLVAGITPTGAMTRVASFIRALAGAITPTGNASRTLSRALVASIASSGAVARAMRYARNLAGTIASAGTLYRYTDRMPDSDIAAGTWVSTEATLFAAINETLTNDATYITSAASPLDDTAIVGVAPLGIPATGPVTLIVRALQV